MNQPISNIAKVWEQAGSNNTESFFELLKLSKGGRIYARTNFARGSRLAKVWSRGQVPDDQ